MPERDILLFIEDILESIEAIEEFTLNMEYDSFVADRKTYSATQREFIVIGEAISKIPEDIKSQRPLVAWRLIKDFRNFIVHEYFGVDPEIVWDAVIKELPVLKKEMNLLIEEMSC
jgi:uncharacterized protein with HEPN domain